MNLTDANFQDLLSVYYEGTQAAVAANYLSNEIDLHHNEQLAVLLRDYRERQVDSLTEIKLRAAVDDLMICYDILEIGVATGFIARPENTDFWGLTKRILDNPHVQNYYIQFYPQRLPQLLRFRMEGRYQNVVRGVDSLAAYVMQFLALDRRFMETLNQGYLLKMLDSFAIEEWSFGDIVHLLGSPAEFIGRILLPPEKREIPDEALNELNFFMQFSFDLHTLLDQLKDYPLVRSEIWSHYGYWFGIIGEQLKDQLGVALNQFLRWTPDNKSPTAAGEIQAYVKSAQDVISKLTSPENAFLVDQVITGVLRTSKSELRDDPDFAL